MRGTLKALKHLQTLMTMQNNCIYH